MSSSLSAFLLLGTLPPAPGRHRLGWMLVDTDGSGDLFVQEKSLQGRPAPAASFGDDYGDDADLDDEAGDDFDGDEAGDDFDGDEAGDEAGDDVGALTKAQSKRRRHLQAQIAKLDALDTGSGRRGKRRSRRGGQSSQMVDKTVTGVGSVATSAGQALTMTVTPKSTFWLKRIAASGDVGALLNTVFAGEIPIVIDPIDTSLLAASAFHQPTFHGKKIRAGVPITVNYAAAGTTNPLRLTFSGRGLAQSC